MVHLLEVNGGELLRRADGENGKEDHYQQSEKTRVGERAGQGCGSSRGFLVQHGPPGEKDDQGCQQKKRG